MKKIKDRLKLTDKYYLYILLFAIILILPYISNLYSYGHDSSYHLGTIFGLSKGNVFDIYHLKIFGFYAKNFGYGAGLFYPQLSHLIPMYIFSLIGNFGFDVTVAVKISKFFVILFSGLFMYKLVNLITKDKKSGLSASFFYMSLPYFLNDLYERDAMAEIYVFAFMPVVFISLYYMLNGEYRKFLIYFVVGCTCLINSHLVMTMYLAFYLIIACLINIKKILNLKNIRYIAIGVGITLLLCSPFIVPLLEHKINGSYLAFLDGYMTGNHHFVNNKLNLVDFFWSNDVWTFTINIILWIILIYVLTNYKKFKEDDKIKKFFISTSLIFMTISFVLMLNFIPWTKFPTLLKFIQFPWRLSTFLGFGFCLFAGIVFSKLDIFSFSKDQLLFIVIISCIFYSASFFTKMDYEEGFWKRRENGIATFDTVIRAKEYLPVSTSENIQFYYDRVEEVRIISGNAKISNYSNNVPKMSFKVTNVKKAKIEIPRIYYLGYKIEAKYSDGTKKKIKYYENENGFIEFKLDKDAIINIKYTGTRLNNIANAINFMTICGCCVYLVISKKKGIE